MVRANLYAFELARSCGKPGMGEDNSFERDCRVSVQVRIGVLKITIRGTL